MTKDNPGADDGREPDEQPLEQTWKSAAPMLNGYRICGVVRFADRTEFPSKVFDTAAEAHAAIKELNAILKETTSDQS